MSIAANFQQQHFANDYAVVDGIAMHAENGDRFQIPHPVLKKHIAAGYFVELRIDSPRFSVHPDAPEKCLCATCNGEASKPVLSHQQPASLVPLPPQNVPSRGWGEDFWVKVDDRQGDVFRAIVDNPLYESRLHNLKLGDVIYFESRHVLAIHPSHRQQMLMGMDDSEIRQLVDWLGQQ
jgi:hypothetical protein